MGCAVPVGQGRADPRMLPVAQDMGLRFMYMPGLMPGKVGVNKRLTLIGDGVDVRGC